MNDESTKYSSLLEVHNVLNLGNISGSTDKEFPKKFISKIYDPLLISLKYEPIKLLEIGVRGGGSIKLWLNFFESIELYGIDICDDVQFDIEGDTSTQKKFTYINEDAYSKNVFRKIPKKLDVLIDDGPHTLESQRYFVANYIGLLNYSGLLFVEDIQALHWVDNLMKAVPKGFDGCIRLIDQRKETGIGDAIVLVIHNCAGNCDIEIKTRNINSLRFRIMSMLGLRKIRYILRRLFLKSLWKIRILLGINLVIRSKE
jgi:hypothetical protein